MRGGASNREAREARTHDRVGGGHGGNGEAED
jgi:hypothetical protein